VHVVVYGRNTATTTVLNEQGVTAPLNLRTNGLGQGESIAFNGSAWSVLASPTPGTSSVPEPDTLILVSAGLLILARAGRRRAQPRDAAELALR
jgi:hypothetical protein